MNFLTLYQLEPTHLATVIQVIFNNIYPNFHLLVEFSWSRLSCKLSHNSFTEKKDWGPYNLSKLSMLPSSGGIGPSSWLFSSCLQIQLPVSKTHNYKLFSPSIQQTFKRVTLISAPASSQAPWVFFQRVDFLGGTYNVEKITIQTNN